MPLLPSLYQPQQRIFRNPHFNTVWASLLRPVRRVHYRRERIDTPDGDFLDLDWKQSGNRKLVIILAGLEGKSNSLYARAAVRHFTAEGWDALGMNYRGCSGESNLLLRGYHMGASDDVKLVTEYAIERYGYREVLLIGYSLGGNLALKYAGEEGENLPTEVKAAVAYSAPLDIEKSDARLNEWYNRHYLKWFMFPLNRKANRKKKQFPAELQSYRGFLLSGNFTYFDTHFTAPANGFADVREYWAASSALPHLHNIKIPALLVSARDDTFISENCYPFQAAADNPHLHLEMPRYGGHCGFIRRFGETVGYMEERALDFYRTTAAAKSEKIYPQRTNNDVTPLNSKAVR